MGPGEPRPARVKTFSCPACGGQVELRVPEQSVVVGCLHCGSLLDASHPEAALIEKYEKKVRLQPLLPLGRRGSLRGQTYEVLGMLRRKVEIQKVDYEWEEYLLRNPYQGYRWLTQYDGHWTFVKPCTGAPALKKGVPSYAGMTFRPFQSAEAEITYVLGEFYWEVRRLDKAHCFDYVSPPFILSREKTGEEVTWSLGEYLTGEEVWTAFQLPGSPPRARGVAPSQPSPYQPFGLRMLGAFLSFLALAVLVQFGAEVLSGKELAHVERFQYASSDAQKARISGEFRLGGRRSNVLVEISSDLLNQWAYFHGALIREEAGEAIDFGREVEYYHGVEGGAAWKEGSQSGSVWLPRVPSGLYYLRIEPETPAATLNYTVRIRRDVPRLLPFWGTLPAITLPYLVFLWRKRSFEHRRWLESDYPAGGSSGSGDG